MPRTPEVEDSNIISYLRNWPKAGVYPSTGTVRDHLNENHEDVEYDRKTVYRRLDSLESAGDIEKIEVGEGRGKSVGWFAEAQPEPSNRTVGSGDYTSDTESDESDESTDSPAHAAGRQMDLPGVMLILLVGGLLGYVGLRAAAYAASGSNTVVDTTDWTLNLRGAVAAGIAGGMVVASFGFLAYLALQALNMAGSGLYGAAAGYAIGILGLCVLMIYARWLAARELTETIEANAGVTA